MHIHDNTHYGSKTLPDLTTKVCSTPCLRVLCSKWRHHADRYSVQRFTGNSGVSWSCRKIEHSWRWRKNSGDFCKDIFVGQNRLETELIGQNLSLLIFWTRICLLMWNGSHQSQKFAGPLGKTTTSQTFFPV